MKLSSQRAEWIRSGNRAFNEKDFRKAKEYFIQANYKSGLIRLGDYYMYDKKLPLLAYGFYKRADAKTKIADIHQRMVMALTGWIGRDSLRPEYQSSLSTASKKNYEEKYEADESGMIPVSVSPQLRQEAIAILRKNNGSKSLN